MKCGKECIILEGFGDKICKIIDEKLEVYLKEGGQLHDDEDIEILDECENDARSDEESKKPRAKKSKKKTSEEQTENECNDNCLDLDSIRSKYPNLLKSSNSKTRINKTKSWSRNSSDEEQELTENTKKAKKTTTRSKEYLPEFRSGAYALLITLLKNEEEEDKDDSYMLKNQLIKEAQKHSDAQFVSNDPRNHYTAWNSMSNLIKKNCVLKENKLPARYRLTDSGRELAKRLLYGLSDKNDENEINSDLEKEICGKKNLSDDKKLDEIEILEKNSNKDSNCYTIDSSDSEKLEDIGCSTGLSQQFFESKIADFPRTISNSNLNSIESELSSNSPNTLFTLLPGSFDIILFIDNCETNA